MKSSFAAAPNLREISVDWRQSDFDGRRRRFHEAGDPLVLYPSVPSRGRAKRSSPVLDYSGFVEKTWTGSSGPGFLFEHYGVWTWTETGVFCPFCIEPLPIAQTLHGLKDAAHEAITQQAWGCEICGWWLVNSMHEDDVLTHGRVRRGILREFSLRDESTPVESLRDHIANIGWERLRHISPRKMEELAQSALAEFFDCNVIHCGKSHDGGIDLLLIDGDSPTAVQVKRRTTVGAESVRTVRELIGAVLVRGLDKAAIVTSAERFSPEAIATRDNGLARRLVSSFQLIDARRFFEILSLTSRDRQPHWSSHFW